MSKFVDENQEGNHHLRMEGNEVIHCRPRIVTGFAQKVGKMPVLPVVPAPLRYDYLDWKDPVPAWMASIDFARYLLQVLRNGFARRDE